MKAMKAKEIESEEVKEESKEETETGKEVSAVTEEVK